MDRSAAESEEVVMSAGTLLDGEDPLSEHRDDPEHWIAVYTELVDSTNLMLGAARERLGAKAGAGRPDAKLIELEIAALVSRSAFFTSRLRWWTQRGADLWVSKPD